MNCEAYQELVATHVDGVLTPAERQEIEYHLGACERCRQLFAEERRFHAAFAARRLIVPVPPEVEQRLRSALVAECASHRPFWTRVGEWLRVAGVRPRFALGLVAAGLLIALLLPRLFSSAPAPDIFTQAVDSYQAAIEGRIALDYQTDDPQELEVAFNRSGQLDFAPQVINLRPAGYRLRGGQVVRGKTHPTAVAVYDGEDDSHIVCLRRGGTMPALPPGTERSNDHYLYTHTGYTVLFTQYPEYCCILISRLPREVFLRRLAMVSAP